MLNHHSYTSLFYHLIWTTKNRDSNILPTFKENLYNYIGKIAIAKKWHLLSVGGTCDHIHILIQKTTQYTISQVVSCLKSNSSKFIRENFSPNFSWQNGYGVFTVDSVSLPRIKNYILKQEQHHLKMSFENEFNLLIKNDVI